MQVILVYTTLLALVSAKQYYISRHKANWYAAVQECAQEGWQLATINSHGEQHDIDRLIRLNDYIDEYIWTSGTDLHAEGAWTWMSTGQPIEYHNWNNPTEPNNNGNDEDCMVINSYLRDSFLWNHLTCSQYEYFICEEKPVLCEPNCSPNIDTRISEEAAKVHPNFLS